MNTSTTLYRTRPFMSGRSQAIRIPQPYRIKEEEVIINKIGECLMITPVSALSELFFSGISSLTDDFLAEGRPAEFSNERTEL